MYKISSSVLDPKKIEHDFSFCGVFSLDSVEECVVKYILAGRGCNYNYPSGVTFDGIKSYVTPNGGEMLYVKEVTDSRK